MADPFIVQTYSVCRGHIIDVNGKRVSEILLKLKRTQKRNSKYYSPFTFFNEYHYIYPIENKGDETTILTQCKLVDDIIKLFSPKI